MTADQIKIEQIGSDDAVHRNVVEKENMIEHNSDCPFCAWSELPKDIQTRVHDALATNEQEYGRFDDREMQDALLIVMHVLCNLPRVMGQGCPLLVYRRHMRYTEDIREAIGDRETRDTGEPARSDAEEIRLMRQRYK